MSFDQVVKCAELASYVVAIATLWYGVAEFDRQRTESRENAQKERVEAAEMVYQIVDQRYTEFVKLSMNHPRLDCYSVPHADKLNSSLSEDEKVQQKMLFTHLTDVFEVAYIQYHKDSSNPEIKKIQDSQWAGWDVYIQKFLRRPAYLETWYEIRDEYDEGFVEYMNTKAQLQSATQIGGSSG